MFSYQELLVMDAVARRGSFSSAATELYKVPSAVSYTIKSLEDRLSVTLFTRLYRKVEITDAGLFFVEQARSLLKQMDEIKLQTQRVANGWHATVSIALDNVVHREKVNNLVADFYQQFPDVELLLTMEVFNGVWDAIADNRADIAIGATAAVPISGNISSRPMGNLNWDFVVSADHALANIEGILEDSQLVEFPCICLEDSSRILQKRTTWLLDNQRRIVVPDWYCAEECFTAGLGIGIMPVHRSTPLISRGVLVKKEVRSAPESSACCIAWNNENMSPAIVWLLEYLGNAEKLQKEWLS
jgi:DNA-binding transcriptional LysR family regulator